jgi:hypothetical protein
MSRGFSRSLQITNDEHVFSKPVDYSLQYASSLSRAVRPVRKVFDNVDLPVQICHVHKSRNRTPRSLIDDCTQLLERKRHA